MPKVILYVFFWIILVLMDLSVNDDVSDCSKDMKMNAGSMLHTIWSALLEVSKTLKEQKHGFK